MSLYLSMPVQNYSLLKGAVINALPYQQGTDHYQVEVRAAGVLYRIAVDVYSQLKGSPKQYSAEGQTTWDIDREVMYYRDDNFLHPITEALVSVAEGLTLAAALPTVLHLDYIRTSPALFPLDGMKALPPKDSGGSGEDLNDDIDPAVQQAMNNAQAEVYALGASWDDDAPGAHPDPHQYFDPNPAKGIHDIHMNQGDSGSEKKYNGVWQDGALLFRFIGQAGAPDKWTAMFFRFTNQSTDTDSKGDPS